MLNNVKVNFAVRTPYYQLCLNVFYDINRLYKRVFDLSEIPKATPDQIFGNIHHLTKRGVGELRAFLHVGPLMPVGSTKNVVG